MTNVQGVLWERVGAVLQTFFCEPATNVSAVFLNIKSGQTAWDTALSTIVTADKNPPQMPQLFVEFFENLLYSIQVCTVEEKFSVKVCALKGTPKSLE